MILVVDDHAGTRDALAVLLRKEGYDARTAPGGRAALNLMRTLHPDVVVLDMKMHDMSGLDVLRQVQEESELKRTKVIVFTGDRDGEDACLKMGAAAYVVKARDSMDAFWKQIHQFAAVEANTKPS